MDLEKILTILQTLRGNGLYYIILIYYLLILFIYLFNINFIYFIYLIFINISYIILIHVHTRFSKLRKERDVCTHISLMERISVKLRCCNVARATQFRTSGIVNGGVRLLVHCIINNLLNRGVTKNRDSTRRTKVSKRPRGFPR